MGSSYLPVRREHHFRDLVETPGLSGLLLFSRSICPLEVAVHSLPLLIPLPQYHSETVALLLLKVS